MRPPVVSGTVRRRWRSVEKESYIHFSKASPVCIPHESMDQIEKKH
jgi:hypothetical protein